MISKATLPSNLRVTDIVSEKLLFALPKAELGPGSSPGYPSIRILTELLRTAGASSPRVVGMRDRPNLVIDETAAMFQAAQ